MRRSADGWGSKLRLIFAARWGERGQIIIIAGLLTPLIIGFAGLALDVGLLMLHRTERQRTADAAALAGAQYLMYNFGTDGVEDQAKQIACTYAEKNGLGTGTCPNSEVTVNLPPTSGKHIGDHSYIEVRITRNDPTVFIRILGVKTARVEARAVGGATPLKRNYALIVLDKTQCDAFTTSSNITITGGGAVVDSAATTGGSCTGISAAQNGGSVVTAQTCYDKAGDVIDCKLDYNSRGSWSVPSNSTASPKPTKAPLFPDPLSCSPPGNQSAEYCPRPVGCSDFSATTPTNCVPISLTACGNHAIPCSANQRSAATNPTITSLTGAGDVTLQPGTYYGGLKINSTSQTVHFQPGIYVFAGADHNGNGGGFSYQSGNICGPATASDNCPTATGVTIFNTSDPYANKSTEQACQGMSITGSGVLKLAAPTVSHSTSLTGYLNMLFWQDDSCSQQFKFAGSSSGSAWTTTGIMYFPNANMQVTGGGNFGSVQIITKTFSQGGSQDIQIKFTRYIDTDTQGYKLVE